MNMKATGVIRRVDDLGRIVITKDIRRTLGIKEGDALELYVLDDGVCFKKYHKYDESDWEKFKRVLSNLIDNFAIFDCYGDCVKDAGVRVANEAEARSRDDVDVYKISNDYESIAYLAVRNDCDKDKVAIARNVFKSLLEDEL